MPASMPKARPLPVDPEERRRLLARREQTKRAVRKWRKVHVDKARALYRHCVTIRRTRLRGRAMLAQLAAA